MRPAFLLFALALFGALGAGPAMAQRAPGVQPLDRLLPQIRRSHPGEFYDADGPTPGANGSAHYHLKWMTPDGRIEWLDTDARTGRVLGSSPGRDSFDGPGRGRAYVPAPSYPTPGPRFDPRDRDDGRGYRGGNDYGDWRGGRERGGFDRGYGRDAYGHDAYGHDGGGHGGYGGERGGRRGRGR